MPEAVRPYSPSWVNRVTAAVRHGTLRRFSSVVITPMILWVAQQMLVNFQ
jgi:hypothetical protein